MGQSGNILPQYRELRAKLKGFIELLKTPHLVAESTVLPVEVLGVDAAVFHSDLMVLSEAMGLNYEIVGENGWILENSIVDENSIEKLLVGFEASANIQYVYDATDKTIEILNN